MKIIDRIKGFVAIILFFLLTTWYIPWGRQNIEDFTYKETPTADEMEGMNISYDKKYYRRKKVVYHFKKSWFPLVYNKTVLKESEWTYFSEDK